MLKRVLEKGLEETITKEEALYLFREVQRSEEFLELAKVASKVRDKEVGVVFKFDGFVGSITSCTTYPVCKYCRRSTAQAAEKPLTVNEIEIAAKLMKSAGIKRIELGGGTVWSGAGKQVIEAVKAVKNVASFDVWINVGPALNADDLMKLKELGVKEVCSSLETINPDVFKEAKPGDTLEARMKLAEEINKIGLGLASVMMVGIGSNYEDYVEHIFWLKGFENLSHFCITGLNPFPGTPFQNKPPANPFEVAKTGAIARLVLRNPDISFGGMMNDWRLLPLAIMAGGNRVIHLGCHVHRANGWRQLRHPGVIVERHGELEFVNMLPLTVRIVKEMGMEVDVT